MAGIMNKFGGGNKEEGDQQKQEHCGDQPQQHKEQGMMDKVKDKAHCGGDQHQNVDQHQGEQKKQGGMMDKVKDKVGGGGGVGDQHAKAGENKHC